MKVFDNATLSTTLQINISRPAVFVHLSNSMCC